MTLAGDDKTDANRESHAKLNDGMNDFLPELYCQSSTLPDNASAEAGSAGEQPARLNLTAEGIVLTRWIRGLLYLFGRKSIW